VIFFLREGADVENEGISALFSYIYPASKIYEQCEKGAG
jgi:hypothetical protein